MEYSHLLTHSLQVKPWGGKVGRILAAALLAVDPFQAVRNQLKISGGELYAASQIYDLESYHNIFIIGAGKAGVPMAQAAAGLLGDRVSGGAVVVKEGYNQLSTPGSLAGIEILSASHPVPDERGVHATRRIGNLLLQAGASDLVICLISGGGSALLTYPADGISLSDIQTMTEALLSSGANINEINTLRKHLDRVKGGNLAGMAAPAEVITLILSDVVGNPLDIIASGPTVPDPSTFQDVMAILQRYDLVGKIPQNIISHIQLGIQGLIPDTPKPGDSLFDRVRNAIIGSNIQAAEAALYQAQIEGYNALLLTTYMQGEARQAGRVLAAIARQINASGQPIPRPACLIVGGETTVTLRGDGMGGRNQELALGAVTDLDSIPDMALITLATDGGDGPTDAAGAVVTGETLSRSRTLGMQPADYLARNDSYHFFEPLGDLLRIGPTQTNVNDLTFLLLN